MIDHPDHPEDLDAAFIIMKVQYEDSSLAQQRHLAKRLDAVLTPFKVRCEVGLFETLKLRALDAPIDIHLWCRINAWLWRQDAVISSWRVYPKARPKTTRVRDVESHAAQGTANDAQNDSAWL